MASSINASTSGVGGVITTADNSGRLDLQTADVTRAYVSDSGLTVNRVNSASEGGQLDLCRSTDNISAWAVDVYGNTSTPSLRFVDNIAGATRMAIDGSGNVLVGTASGSPTSGYGFKYVTNGNSPYLAMVVQTTSSADGNYHLYSTGAGAFRFYVGGDGRVNATLTTIAAISDERLKENIRDLDVGLSDILNLKPRRFDWKENKGSNTKNVAGFIAQEFEQVFPASVNTSMAGEDGIEYKNICHDELIPTLVKAIQELKAIVDTQAERIAVLESKIV